MTCTWHGRPIPDKLIQRPPNADGDGVLVGMEGATFFRGSGVDDGVLSYVWRASTQSSKRMQFEVRIAVEGRPQCKGPCLHTLLLQGAHLRT